MTITAEQAHALIALAAALETCHKLNVNVIAKSEQVSLMINGQQRIMTHTLDHKSIREMRGIDVVGDTKLRLIQ